MIRTSSHFTDEESKTRQSVTTDDEPNAKHSPTLGSTQEEFKK